MSPNHLWTYISIYDFFSNNMIIWYDFMSTVCLRCTHMANAAIYIICGEKKKPIGNLTIFIDIFSHIINYSKKKTNDMLVRQQLAIECDVWWSSSCQQRLLSCGDTFFSLHIISKSTSMMFIITIVNRALFVVQWLATRGRAWSTVISFMAAQSISKR